MISVLAVYENGVLRPKEPLALAEGQTVAVTVSDPKPSEPPMSEEEILRRIESAQSIREWVEATKLLPPDDGGYDIVAALDENRRWSGDRPLLPDEGNPP
jgi:predicted DNA-binding antitoxin AbrB/MazE fold protein